MQGRTRLIIAGTLVLLGIGVVGLGFLEDESSVRYVRDVHTAPDALASGAYTLMGIPQPATLDGANNSAYAPQLVAFDNWVNDGAAYRTEYRSSVEPTPEGHRFTIEARTTLANSQTPVGELRVTTYDLVGSFQVFQVEDFQSGERIWAAFGGTINGGIQPKPSQLVGHVDPGAPAGLLLWQVEPDGYTAQCSSKFLPDDVRDTYDADGDGVTD